MAHQPLFRLPSPAPALAAGLHCWEMDPQGAFQYPFREPVAESIAVEVREQEGRCQTSGRRCHWLAAMSPPDRM